MVKMKELILWQEVKDESKQGEPGTIYFKVDTMPDGIYLKRISIPILSNEEIFAEAKKEYETVDNNDEMIYGYKYGYKAMQDKIIGE
jgi:hypothetical protein